MRCLLGLMFAVGCASPAMAREVAVDGDYGCTLFRTQVQRLQLMEAAFTGSALRAQGRQTADSKADYERATAELVQLSNTECKPLTGRFKVLESRDVPGGKALKLEQPHGTWTWILQ